MGKRNTQQRAVPAPRDGARSVRARGAHETRIRHIPLRPQAVQIRTEVLLDPQLSLEAKGMYALLAAMSDLAPEGGLLDSEFPNAHQENLSEDHGQAALNELMSAGLISTTD